MSLSPAIDYFYVAATFNDDTSTAVGIRGGKVCYVKDQREALQLRRLEDADQFKEMVKKAGLPRYDNMTGKFKIKHIL